MNKFFTFFLVLGFALVLPMVAKANCQWTLHAECKDIGQSWVLATYESFCDNSGLKPNGTTAKCCCGDNPNCCSLPTGAWNVVDAAECTAKYQGNFHANQVADCYKKNCVAPPTHSFQDCSGCCSLPTGAWNVVDVNECTSKYQGNFYLNYVVNSNKTTCIKAPVPDVQGCCEIRETDTVKLIETAQMMLRSQCEAKQQVPSYGQTGTTVSVRFSPSLVVDDAGKKCVQSITKSGLDGGGTPGLDGGGTPSKEVKFDYSGMTNPLRTINPSEVAGRVIKAVLAIIGSIFLMMIIYGGFIWMTAAGNDSKVQTGRNVLVWAIIGIIVIFLAWMLVAVIFESLAV